MLFLLQIKILLYEVYVFELYILLILNMSRLLKSQSIDNGCWPWNIVMFQIDPTFAEDQTQLILERMRHISLRTCLRFVNTKDHHSEDDLKKYLEIRKSTSRYCSTVEMQRDGALVVLVDLGTTCTNKGGILHELVHSLGFRNEHQRTDRKCYVKVNWSKVTQVSYFEIDYNDTNRVWLERFPYDKGSIMHPPRTEQLKSRDERIHEWEPLGNVDGSLTFWDIWKISYKHCMVHHFCDLNPQQCHTMEMEEKSLECKGVIE